MFINLQLHSIYINIYQLIRDIKDTPPKQAHNSRGVCCNQSTLFDGISGPSKFSTPETNQALKCGNRNEVLWDHCARSGRGVV